MPDVVSLAIAIVGIAFGVGSLLWARRRVARERDRAERAERNLTASGLERTLLGGSRAVKAALQTASQVRERGLGGLLSSLDEVAGWAEVERPDLRRIAARDGTVTIMFSDIEDSTAINERIGDRAWVKLLGVRKEPLRVRIGIHLGKAVEKNGDLFGRNVAFAARVAAAGEGGQILVSSATAEHVDDLADVELVPLREVELKGLPGEHELFEVKWSEAP